MTPAVRMGQETEAMRVDSLNTAVEVAAQVAAWAEKNGATPRERARLARQVFDGVCERLRPDGEKPGRIAAQNAVVEVLDGESGRLYRRYLELGFEETGNGLRLMGEDMGAVPVQIVFLSGAALEHMNELRGNGPDAPRCGGHD